MSERYRYGWNDPTPDLKDFAFADTQKTDWVTIIMFAILSLCLLGISLCSVIEVLCIVARSAH